jgi:hypothetical protein
MFVLPGFAADPAVNGKLTALAVRLRVRDSASVAFSAIGCAPEFRTCAEAKDAAPVTISAIASNRVKVCDPVAKFIYQFSPFYFLFRFAVFASNKRAHHPKMTRALLAKS